MQMKAARLVSKRKEEYASPEKDFGSLKKQWEMEQEAQPRKRPRVGGPENTEPRPD